MLMERPVAQVELQTVESLTPIFAFDLSSRSYELEKAKLAVNELQITNPEKRTSNVYGEWLSPKNSHQLNSNLLPLCNLALDITNQVWVDVFSGGEGNFRDDFYIWQCWSIVYGQGGYAASHNHFPSFFSCVIYLEADNVSAPIIFGKNEARPAIQNAMYLFPGILQHEVPENKGRRIAVAMNILKKNPV